MTNDKIQMTKSAKSLLVVVAVLMAGVVRADAPQIWMTQRSVLVWDAPVDAARAGWNVVLVGSGMTTQTMPASDAQRSADTNNSIRVITWAILSNPATNRFYASTLIGGNTWQSGTVLVSARDIQGNYSDWVGFEAYNPDPGNVRLK